MNLLILTCLLAIVQSPPVIFGQDLNEGCCEEYCYGSDRERPQTRQYSSKTAYEVVRGGDYGKQYQVLNCKPTKMWFLNRHGTRNPSAKTIRNMQKLEDIRDKIIKNYEERKSGPMIGGLCPADKSLLKMWKLNKNITENYASFLTFQGWQDMKFLAKNYQRNFENILDKQYDETKFLFRHTDTQRTESSFKAFAEGLFGDNAHERIHLPSPQKSDNLLRPYENCPSWQEQDYKIELSKFEESSIMNKTIFDISQRLGFRYKLERDEIELIWDMCRYEQAWHVDRSSAWCVAFTPAEVTVLEYAEDLKYYYASGYGYERNSRITCAAVKDMLINLNSSSQPQAVAYFTHSSAIQLFLTALGISKDREALRANNMHNMKDRHWKISLLGPFAANFVAIKYQCANDPQEAKAMFFINQMPVNLDWCHVGLCNWGDVMINYEKFLKADCDTYYCDPNNSSTIQLSLVLWFTIIIYVFISTVKF